MHLTDLVVLAVVDSICFFVLNRVDAYNNRIYTFRSYDEFTLRDSKNSDNSE